MSRNRVISLRLSEDELEGLKKVCRMHGSRSLSDLARLGLRRLIDAHPPSGETLENRLHELDNRLKEMDRKLMELAHGAARSSGPG